MKRGREGVFRYLAEVDFVKDDLIGMTDAPEAGHKSQGRDDDQGDPVVPFGTLARELLVGFDEAVELSIIARARAVGFLLGPGDIALAQTALGWSGSRRHDARGRGKDNSKERTKGDCDNLVSAMPVSPWVEYHSAAAGERYNRRPGERVLDAKGPGRTEGTSVRNRGLWKEIFTLTATDTEEKRK